MPNALLQTIQTETRSPRTSYRAWVHAIGGAVAGGCAVLAVYACTGPASGLLMDLAWDRAAGAKSTLAFQMQGGLSDTQILGGVSGEAVNSRVAGLKLTDLTQATMNDSNALSPLALDRLSAGDCITLTTSTGQKLSFRIEGAGTAEASRAASSSTAAIDLAITACAPSSDAILKAVIESRTDSKQSAVQRSL